MPIYGILTYCLTTWELQTTHVQLWELQTTHGKYKVTITENYYSQLPLYTSSSFVNQTLSLWQCLSIRDYKHLLLISITLGKRNGSHEGSVMDWNLVCIVEILESCLGRKSSVYCWISNFILKDIFNYHEI